ncbi:tyrosine-type recombinase/integrase [Chitinibacter sp. GC72]|uniref:tyrosine-type recombinase/integrase n=1 Tax=Chitinibacter sp. GC72 TaxID=1526917 RepID=UPI0018DF8B4A|nr:tyrosine-type recombinase/integrase [Chitinibacter sp. GC72]
MRARHRGEKVWYYYDAGGKPRREVPLGDDYVIAVLKWAELEKAERTEVIVITFRHAAERYIRDVLPEKAPRTQKDNLTQLAKLLAFFDDPPAPLDQIEPINIRQFLDWRVAETKERLKRAGKEDAAGDGRVRANREKALFSHIWNFARSWGYTNKPNPCQGIAGYREHARDVYVDDAAYNAVYQQADIVLRDAMDLAWLTGQRPADILKMSEADVKDGVLWVKQNKTGAKLRISVVGQLAEVIERIMTRKQAYKVHSLKLLIDEVGKPLTESMLRHKFDHARELSGQTWQFRDLRAKAGTEKEMDSGMSAAQDLLAHTTQNMTSVYVRNRVGKLVTPTR